VAVQEGGVMKGLLVSGAALFWALQPAHAFDVSGNEFLSLCAAAPGSNRGGFTVGYVMGVVQGRRGLVGMCMPVGITGAQLRDLACKYIQDNPAQRASIASDLVGSAIEQAWPCSRT